MAEHGSRSEATRYTPPPELVCYIQALSEPIGIYTRYMDALLIKGRGQPSFFRDLSAFRCQAHIAGLLCAPSSPDFDTKAMFSQVTKCFLDSRYAHPWCRRSELHDGWSDAKWAKGRKQTDARAKQEQKLNKLLVPIWCGFRVRMMPSQEVLGIWLEQEQQREEARKQAPSKLSTDIATTSPQGKPGGMTTIVEAPSRMFSDADSSRLPKSSSKRNEEAYCMEISDDELPGPSKDNDDAAAAAKLFVGAAATGFLASNKRARKYLRKKLNKK